MAIRTVALNIGPDLCYYKRMPLTSLYIFMINSLTSMYPLTTAALLTLCLGVSGLKCYVGSFTSNNPPTRNICFAASMICYSKVIDVQGTITYEYGCDSSYSKCGIVNTGGSVHMLYLNCCSDDYCNPQVTEVFTVPPVITTTKRIAPITSVTNTPYIPKIITGIPGWVTVTNSKTVMGSVGAMICAVLIAMKYTM